MTSQAAQPCPFTPAKDQKKYVRMLLWGESGSGKTWASLYFPKICMIDFEKGSDHYTHKGFHRLRPKSITEFKDAIKWLRANDHNFETLVIDSLTIYYMNLQRKWSEIFKKRNTTATANKGEFYDLGPKEWQTINGELFGTIEVLNSLNMNIICIAHAKNLYSGSGFMEKIGLTYDIPQKSPHFFDTVVQLEIVNGKRKAYSPKDRTFTFPENEYFLLTEQKIQKMLQFQGRAAATKTTEKETN